MEPFSYTSPSSSFYTSYQGEEIKIKKAITPSYLSSLHSVRKPLPKPMTKKPIAPLPPTPPKVYLVDSTQFKQVVRKLTSIPEFQYPPRRRLQDLAPPPLNLSSTPKLSLSSNTNTTAPPPPPPMSPLGFNFSPNFCSFLNDTLDSTRTANNSKLSPVDFGAMSPLAFTLLPSFYNLIGETVPPEKTCKMPKLLENSGGLLSPLGFSLLSPSSLSWCSSALLSPGTLSAMGQSTVL